MYISAPLISKPIPTQHMVAAHYGGVTVQPALVFCC